jgi:hypothetical protein
MWRKRKAWQRFILHVEETKGMGALHTPCGGNERRGSASYSVWKKRKAWERFILHVEKT